MNDRPDGRDKNRLITAGSRIQAAAGDSLGDRFPKVGVDLIGARIAVLGSRAWEIPMKIGMSQLSSETALFADPARLAGTRILTE